MFKFPNLVSISIFLILTISSCTQTANTANNSNPQTTVSPEQTTQETSKIENDSQTAKSSLALSNDGIQTVNTQTGSTKNFTFDSDLAIAQNVVTAILGQPKETSENAECPAGKLTTITWPNGFAINASENKFVGWSVRSQTESAKLATMAGISIGSTVKDLQAAYNVQVFNSSLGIEFNVGQMSGLLSKNAPDGVITDLWAGTNCIFR